MSFKAKVCLFVMITAGLITFAMSQSPTQQAQTSSSSSTRELSNLTFANTKLTTRDQVTIVLSIVGSVFGCMGLIVSIKNHRTSKQSVHAKIAWDTLNYLESKDGETSLLTTLVREAEDNGKEFIYASIKQGDRDKLHQLARAWDTAGLLVKHKVIPTSILFDFYSKPIVRSWQHLETMVKAERNARNQRGHMGNFEIVATGAALYRKDKKGEEPKFTITPDIEAQWKQWKTNVW